MSKGGKGSGKKKAIDPASSYEGALGAQRNARRLFGDALLLHSAGRFQGAIPPAILAIEECLKGIELGIEFRKMRGIPAEAQGWLTSHPHKLGHVPGWVAGNMEDGRMRDVHAGLVREGKVPLVGGRPVSVEDAIENSRYMRDVVSGLQHVKEMCVYERWDEKRGSWGGLGLDGADAEALSVFVLALAEAHYGMLHRSTEFALDTLVAKNPAFEKHRVEKAELDAMEVDPGKARRGEAVLFGMYEKAGVLRAGAGGRGAG